MREACLRGVGVALLLAFCCEDHLESGALVRLLPSFQTSPDRGSTLSIPTGGFCH